MELNEKRDLRSRNFDEQEEILETANGEGRDFTDEERTKLDELQSEEKRLSSDIDRLAAFASRKAKDEGWAGQAPKEAPTGPEGVEQFDNRSWGTQFVESENYKNWLKRGGASTGGTFSVGGVEIRTTFTELTGSGGKVIQPDIRPGVLPILFRTPRVSDLMPQGTTSTNLLRYIKETTATNAATTVAEGAPKPESTLVLDQVDDPVQKIATTLPVSDEMLEDWTAARSYIDGRLRLFIELVEDDQLLNGDGTAPNISGILDRTGLQTPQAIGADNRPDAIYKAVTKIRSNAFLEPDGLVIHPNDWEKLRLLKDDNLQYYGGGPFTGAYGNGAATQPTTIWDGLRVVITSAITEGISLVGAFAASAQVWRRSGITVDATNSHASEFVSNITRIRAEERLALAVYRPGGFCVVDYIP